MKKLVLALMVLLAAVTFADAKEVDVSQLQVRTSVTGTARQDKIAGTSKDGITIYEGRRGGLYWKDQAGKKHYIRKTE